MLKAALMICNANVNLRALGGWICLVTNSLQTRTASVLKKMDFIDVNGNMRKLIRARNIICLCNLRKELEVFLK